MHARALTLICLLALLTSQALSHAGRRVTAGSRLPAYVDNLLHNARAPRAGGLGAKPRKVAHFQVEVASVPRLVESVAAMLPWAGEACYLKIRVDLAALTEDEVRSHYVFRAFPAEGVFRYAVVNVYMTEEGRIGAVVGQDVRKGVGVKRETSHHDVKVSLFGLSFDRSLIVYQNGIHKAEFHEFNRNVIMGSLLVERANQISGLGLDIGAIMSSAGGFFKSISDSYTTIANAFKTVKKDEFKEKITGGSFDYYKSHSQYQRSIGVPINKMALYTTKLTRQMGLDNYPEVQKNVSDKMEAITEGLSDADDWSMNDLTFDKDKSGSCDSIIFAMTKDEPSNKVNLLITYVKGSFRLSPDLMVYQKIRSYGGGIVETTETKIEEVARGITKEEIKAIHACMILSGIQILSDNLGFNIKLPELSIIINNA